GRILGMCGCGAQRQPRRVRIQIGITAAGWDSGYGPPESVLVFHVVAPDRRVSISGPQHCQQPCTLRHTQTVVIDQITEGTRVLLSGLFGPVNTDLGFGRRTNITRSPAQEPRESVVALPGFAGERSGSIRKEIPGSAHRKRTELGEPRRD